MFQAKLINFYYKYQKSILIFQTNAKKNFLKNKLVQLILKKQLLFMNFGLQYQIIL